MFCKRPLVSIYVIILLFFIFSCKNETSIDNLTEGYPPSHDAQNKTFVEIKNNSQYDVNVYYDSNLQHLLTCIPSGKTIKNYVGGVCGEIGEASNILSINTNVEANSSGGNGSFWGLGDSLQGTNVGDGILNSYAGSVFGGDVFSGSEKFVSYNNSTPRVYTNVLAYNPTTERISSLLGVTDFTVKNSYYISDFASLNNSPILDWENWRIQDSNPENSLD